MNYFISPAFVLFWSQIHHFSFVLTGEVERLLKDYQQNQDFIRNLGNRFYQIIYPIQVRQRERFGVSTREIAYGKVMEFYGAIHKPGGPFFGHIYSIGFIRYFTNPPSPLHDCLRGLCMTSIKKYKWYCRLLIRHKDSMKQVYSTKLYFSIHNPLIYSMCRQQLKRVDHKHKKCWFDNLYDDSYEILRFGKECFWRYLCL